MHINPSAWPFGSPRVLAPTSSTSTRGSSSSSRPPSATSTPAGSSRRVSSTRLLPSTTSTRVPSSSSASTSSAGTTSGSLSQSAASSALSSTSVNASTRPISTIRLSTSSSSSRVRTTLGTPSASQTGSFQNLTQKTTNMPYSAIFIALLALLLIIVLAVLFYARKAARRNRSSAASSEYGPDDDVEKAPLTTALPYQQRDNYAPGDFLHVDIDGQNESTRQPSRHQATFAEETSEEKPRSLWKRASDLARRQSSALRGNVRHRDIEQGSDEELDQDVSRIPPLPPAITVEPPTPIKSRPVGRLFSGTKEPKSPKPPRRQKKASGGGSAPEQARSSYGQLAGSISPDRLDHLMSLASAKVPPHVTTAPRPLRKRHVSREAVGAPIVTSPIYPGEMMRRPPTALLTVEAARSRVAAARSRAARSQPSSEAARVSEQLQSPEQAPLDMIAEADPEMNSQEVQHVPDDQDGSQEEEEDLDQHPSPTAQSTRISRPTSVLRPASASSGKRDAAIDVLDQAKNPFPWVAAPSRAIDFPLDKRIRRNLLSGRLVLDGTRSHDEITRKPSPIAHVLDPEFRKQSRTTAGDERRASSEIGTIDLSPLIVPGFPGGTNFLQTGEREPESETSPPSSWAGSRRSSELLAAITSFGARASRVSATLWSGSDVEPQAFLASGSRHSEGTQNQRKMQELREEEAEEREQPADLQSQQVAPRQYNAMQEDPTRRRSSAAWSESSTYSQEPTAPRRAEDFAIPHSIIPPSIEPLKLATSRSPAPLRHSPADVQRASEGIAPTENRISPAGGFAMRASPARFALESPPSPTTKIVDRGRVDSIAGGIMGFFDRPRDTFVPARPTSSTKPLEGSQQPSNVHSLTIPLLAPVTSSPASPFLSHVERPRISERVSTPRKTTTPSALPNIEHFRGRKTVTPAAESTVAKPRLRFSDDVEVFAKDLDALSPPAPTISSLTPPSLRRQSHYTGNILSPQPLSRRSSILPPLPTSSPHIAKASPNISAIREPLAGPSGTAGTPPKAVQIRELWREIRRTSVTAYYLGAIEAEHDSEDDGDEGGSGLR